MIAKPRAARRAFGLFFVAALGLSIVACEKKPVAGDPCRDIGKGSCVDGSHALTCRSYSWHLDACRGTNGCRQAGESTTCDESIAEAGDLCADRGQNACAHDGKSMLRCDGAKYAAISSCRGADGCEEAAGKFTCDTRVAKVGDPCVYMPYAQTPKTACNAESNAELTCVDGVYVLYDQCRGAKGCAELYDGARCDQRIARAGDPCHTGRYACSEDGHAALRCTDTRNGVWRVTAKCGGPDECVADLESDNVRCDQTVANVGDECSTNVGLRACTPDKKSMLACEDVPDPAAPRRHLSCERGPRAMEVVHRCPHDCEVTDSGYKCI